MSRKNTFYALIACSFAFASALCLADESPSRVAEGSETPALIATTDTAPAPTMLAWPATPAPVRKLKEKGIPNFGKLNEFIWRSGQPSKEGYARLKEMGVKTIVNLRREAPADKDKLPEGINYINIPVVDERAPTAEQAQQFIDIAADPKNWPILVHCHGGEGRAGVMSALVRYEFDGWESSKIDKETGSFRVAHLGFIKTRMCGSQRDFLKEWVSNHKAGEYSAKIGKPSEIASSK